MCEVAGHTMFKYTCCFADLRSPTHAIDQVALLRWLNDAWTCMGMSRRHNWALTMLCVHIRMHVCRYISGADLQVSGALGSNDLSTFFTRLKQASPQASLVLQTAGAVQLSVQDVPVKDASAAASMQPEVGDSVWIVVNALASGTARDIAVKAWHQSSTKMIPWVGVAARLSGNSNSSSFTSNNISSNSSLGSSLDTIQDAGQGQVAGDKAVALSSSSAPEAPVAGQAFCFLPLPIPTGLPVHVNAFFELSSNRRDIW